MNFIPLSVKIHDNKEELLFTENLETKFIKEVEKLDSLQVHSLSLALRVSYLPCFTYNVNFLISPQKRVNLLQSMSQLVVSISGRELQLQHKPINLVQTDGDRELLLDSMFEEPFSVQHDLSNKMQYCKTVHHINMNVL